MLPICTESARGICRLCVRLHRHRLPDRCRRLHLRVPQLAGLPLREQRSGRSHGRNDLPHRCPVPVPRRNPRNHWRHPQVQTCGFGAGDSQRGSRPGTSNSLAWGPYPGWSGYQAPPTVDPSHRSATTSRAGYAIDFSTFTVCIFGGKVHLLFAAHPRDPAGCTGNSRWSAARVRRGMGRQGQLGLFNFIGFWGVGVVCGYYLAFHVGWGSAGPVDRHPAGCRRHWVRSGASVHVESEHSGCKSCRPATACEALLNFAPWSILNVLHASLRTICAWRLSGSNSVPTNVLQICIVLPATFNSRHRLFTGS